ncbi:extracellular solute-binding protein [Bacillus sp. 3255]|uniref:extracellular solute-binding protein n=1 Tax=Bacillus sp. 3255 TaxID=2817904 RepID=UPI00285A3C94|nr:extracellular solute-binding protein [Bacillus sp. 3255]MDR6879922.1 ABC-type glycerol-3-phosphate transport system substrate-binding protein [Bacillus sp. 3255]
MSISLDRRKAIPLTLILFAITMLAGCSRGVWTQQETEKPVTDPSAMRITVVNQSKYAPIQNENLFVAEIEKRFQMKWEYRSIPITSGMDKFNVMFASGQIPDLVLTMNNFSAVKNWADAGYLLPIGDYIDRLPHYRQLFNEEEWKDIQDFAAIRGKLYMLPSKIDVKDPMAWIYRKDAFERAGITEFPRTTEAFYASLLKIKAANPSFEGIGVRGGPNATGIKSLLAGFQHAFRLPPDFGGVDGWTGFWNDPDEQNRLVFAPATTKQRDMLVYLAKMYREGLIEKEFATLSEEQWAQKRRNGRNLIDFQWASQVVDLQKADPGANWDYSHYHLQAYEKPGLEFRSVSVSLYGPLFSSKLAKDEAKLNRILAYIDWAATDEGRLFHMMGKENVTYRITDGEVRYKAGEDRRKVASEYGFDWFLSKSPAALATDEPARKANEAWQVYQKLPYVEPRNAPLSDQDWETMAIYMSTVQEVVNRFATKAVMGLEDVTKDSVWQEYLNELDKAGLQQMLTIFQKYWK